MLNTQWVPPELARNRSDPEIGSHKIWNWREVPSLKYALIEHLMLICCNSRIKQAHESYSRWDGDHGFKGFWFRDHVGRGGLILSLIDGFTSPHGPISHGGGVELRLWSFSVSVLERAWWGEGMWLPILIWLQRSVLSIWFGPKSLKLILDIWKRALGSLCLTAVAIFQV